MNKRMNLKGTLEISKNPKRSTGVIEARDRQHDQRGIDSGQGYGERRVARNQQKMGG
jgi:hypothetical protein